jgi:Mlc titration factor MtfA (ptsG expression regulator)
MLVLNRGSEVYPGLKYIIVYPAAFVARHEAPDELGLVRAGDRDLLGESWSNGKVILAWDSVLSGASNFTDGHNVTLHEFAHQLDGETGNTNGAPLLAGASSYRSWSRAFTAEFDELQQDARVGRQTLLDHYGASNPAEFFAVATETFFERPDSMAQHHGELFGLLQDYYRIDPRSWRDALA